MSDLLHAVGFSAGAWGERLWQASWQSALVLAVAWAIARWCKFLSPRVTCWVLRLACLKLLVALFWVDPIGLPLLPATPVPTVSRETIVTPVTTEQPASEEPPLVERLTPVGQIEPQPGTVTDRIGQLPLLQSLWLAGFCGCVLITIGRWLSIRKLCRAADPSRSIGLEHSLRLEAERLGIRRLPRLRLSPRADGPLLAGIARPMIILPNRVEESFDEFEIRLALAHELAHLKRRDLLWNWLPTIVGSLFWFHPLVWLIKRRWCEAQEAACDELLIQNHVARPAEYGRLLLKLAADWPQLSGAAPIAVGMFGSYRNLERRILTMTRVRAFSLRRLLIAAATLSLVAVPGIVPWRLVAQEADRADQPVVAGDPQRESHAAAPKTPRSHTLDPKFIEAAGRGLAAFEQRDYAQALLFFDEAIRIDHNDSEARRWRGDALLNQGEFDKALAAYDDAIRLDPKNGMAYLSRGMAWTEKGEPDKALDDFQQAIKLRPVLAKTTYYRRYVAAAKSLRSKTHSPSFPEAAKRGLAAFEKRDYAGALADFDEAIRIDPNHSEVRRWRGDALLNQGEYDKALASYEDAIRLNPKNAMAYVSRGMAWTGKREPGPALIAFETALGLDPKQANRPLFKRYVALAQSLLTSSPNPGFDHPEKEKSPFAAVRWKALVVEDDAKEILLWQGAQPEVKVGDDWFKLVSLDGVPASAIVAFSRRNFGDRWQMRFEEDLVELLTRMGHPPKDTATLVVQTLTSSETRTFKDVPMTAANRLAIKAAADARKASDQ